MGRAVNRPPRAILGLLAAALLAAPSARADEIRLRHGGVIFGRVIAETERQLVVEVPYGRITVARKDIAEVIRESEDEYLRAASDRILRAGDVAQALDLLRRARALAPEDPARLRELLDALERAALVWIDANRLEEAEALLDEGHALGGDADAEAAARRRIRELRHARAERERRAIDAWNAGSFETAHRLWSELRAENPHAAERWRKPLAAASLRLGHDALLGRRLDDARRLYLESLELDPDRLADVREPLALCEVERIRPHLAAGRFEAAERELDTALEILPDDPALLFHRALVDEARGDTRAAGRIYARLAGERNRAIDGQRYLEDLRQRAASRVQRGVALAFREERAPLPAEPRETELAAEVRGGPFVVHHAQGSDAEDVLQALRRHLARFEEEWFGGLPALPTDLEIEVHLHPGRAALLASGATELAGCDGYVRTGRRYGILVGQEIHLNAEAVQLTSAVVPHELAHLLLPHRIGPGLVLPPWLDEGIACSEEPELLRRHRRRTLADARRAGEEWPLADLLGIAAIPAERTEIFYAQSASVIEFLRERLGTFDLLLLAKQIALAGVESALREVAGYDTVSDLELAWRRSLEE